MTSYSKGDAGKEADIELKKSSRQLAEDIIYEANKLPDAPAGEQENLDIIKHLLKRIALHQLALDEQGRKTNKRLLVLSVVMAVGAFFTILQFFLK